MTPGQTENGNSEPGGLPSWQQAFIDEHGLGRNYLAHARHWFASLVREVVLHQKSAGRPVLVALNGSQGSGKTTLCDYLAASLSADHGLRVIALSLDDFYLTARQRQQLAQEVHPLLATRGVPGTHDIQLLQATLDALMSEQPVRIPRFDKACDDRKPQAEWDEVAAGVDVILLEGWCMGASAQNEAQLVEPINVLEAEEDADGSWRHYVNRVLQTDFPPLYQRVDLWVMLQAPSFECVHYWRLEQEQKLARRSSAGKSGVMDEGQLARFIRHYQRLTEHCLAELPVRVDHLYCLGRDRKITAYHQRRSLEL